MTESADGGGLDGSRDLPALGVDRILTGSFRIFFSRGVVWITIAASMPFALVVAAFFLLAGDVVIVQSFDGPRIAVGTVALAWLLAVVTFIFAVAVTLLAAYDELHGRRLQPVGYATAAARRLFALTVCGLLIWNCVFLAAVALLVPALWLYAVWSVALPAILIEGHGVAALKRSAALTRGYRWPALAALAGLAVCSILLWTALGFVVDLLAGWAPASALVLNAVGVLVTGGVFHVGTTLIYARLREIKEGVDTDTIAVVVG